MITSTANSQVKELAALLKKAKERRKKKAFVVEGIRIAREVPKEDIQKIYFSEALSDAYQKGSLDATTAQWMKERSADCKGRIEVLSDHVFSAVSDTVTPQGVMVVAAMHERKALADTDASGCFLILENIQDPGNLGTMMRTAEAAGVTGIIMSKDTVDIYSPKVVRSTMGAIFRVPFWITENLAGAVQTLKEKKVRIFAAHLKGVHQYYQEDFEGPCGIMIGNEGNGLTDQTAELADIYVKIPMEGKVESLNAAMAAGILMYESYRQNHR